MSAEYKVGDTITLRACRDLEDFRDSFYGVGLEGYFNYFQVEVDAVILQVDSWYLKTSYAPGGRPHWFVKPSAIKSDKDSLKLTKMARFMKRIQERHVKK